MVSGIELAAMEEGWSALLDENALGHDALDQHAVCRGRLLFRYSARLLGHGGAAEEAGERWALADLARHSARDAPAALAAAAAIADPAKWPKPLRPLGMLDTLARRDISRGPASFERPGSPGRMLRMIRHRLTGH